jgi:S-adenosylmethionine/arginine decarboxylase-like enzyme
MILREKDFRTAMLAHDWTVYQDKVVAVYCSVDAIIPMWAYMIISSALQPFAKTVYFGTENDATEQYLLQSIHELDTNGFIDQRVVVKGCGDTVFPAAAFVAITQKLKPVVKSLMYGEPCSTVPVYKKK